MKNHGAFVACLCLLALLACREDVGDAAAPDFPEELKQVSQPRDGMLPYFRGESMDPYWPAETSASASTLSVLPEDIRRYDEGLVLQAHGVGAGL